jgi:hypothetical protein
MSRRVAGITAELAPARLAFDRPARLTATAVDDIRDSSINRWMVFRKQIVPPPFQGTTHADQLVEKTSDSTLVSIV